MTPNDPQQPPTTPTPPKDTKTHKLTHSAIRFLASPKKECVRRAQKKADKEAEQEKLRNRARDEPPDDGIWNRCAAELEAIRNGMEGDIMEEVRAHAESEARAVEETAAAIQVLRENDEMEFQEAIEQYRSQNLGHWPEGVNDSLRE